MSLEIAAIGDVGIYDQKVKSLAKSIPDHQISFLALLGDNFYPTGIQNGIFDFKPTRPIKGLTRKADMRPRRYSIKTKTIQPRHQNYDNYYDLLH